MKCERGIKVDENMQSLCAMYGVDFQKLYNKTVKNADLAPTEDNRITVTYTVHEQRVLRAALEIAGGM